MCWLNLLTAKRSINLDVNDRLDIGLYDFSSNGSSDGFFNIGRTIACLRLSGNTPDSNDFLTMASKIGTNMSLDCLIIHAGTGSIAHCLFGALRIASAMSSVENWPKLSNDVTARRRISGSRAAAVDALMTSVLSLKNVAKAFGV